MAFATLVFDRKDKRRIEAFQVVVALSMFLPLMAIHGYLLSASAFQSLGRKPTTEMAIPTLVLFCVSGAAFFSFFPRQGLVSLILGRDLAGITVRRLLPMVILVPFALAWILYSFSLYTLILVGLLVALSLEIGHLIRRHEVTRKANAPKANSWPIGAMRSARR
jgi:uncharacterized membrane protein